MLDWKDIQIFLEVARNQRLTDASRRLGLDHSTLSRRTRLFEQKLNTQLFDRSTRGYNLTDAGQQLLAYAELMAQNATEATEILSNKNRQIRGKIRLGVTEGFGSWVIAPLLCKFGQHHPSITIDILTLPRFVNLSRHEADLAITIERPSNQGLVVSRLCDYRLQLYAGKKYLSTNSEPASISELSRHRLIGYVNDFIFSDQLNYLDPLLPLSPPSNHECFSIRGTSVITQYHATLHGAGLAILPCFMAEPTEELSCILKKEVDVVRQFWITARQDQRRLARVRLLWDYLRKALDINKDFLMGITSQLIIPEI